jgi:hypothetical protein
MTFRFKVLFLLLLLSLSIVGCSQNDPRKGHDWSPLRPLSECTQYDFDLQIVEHDSLPFLDAHNRRFTDTSLVRDDDGVILWRWTDDSLYYHPVVLCHDGFYLLAEYGRTSDTALLRLAEAYGRRLVAEADTFDGHLFFPYTFDYSVHQNEQWKLTADWYSGMAQGEAVGLFCRLFEATCDSLWFAYATQTLGSLTHERDDGFPWVVFTDSIGCFWIEEYPTTETSKTLNGFIYALYGVYDYYRIAGDSLSKRLLTRSMSTIKNYLPLFRRPDSVSYYNLTYRHYAENYHEVHIEQLRKLYLFSGDTTFAAYADSFRADWQVGDYTE